MPINTLFPILGLMVVISNLHATESGPPGSADSRHTRAVITQESSVTRQKGDASAKPAAGSGQEQVTDHRTEPNMADYCKQHTC